MFAALALVIGACKRGPFEGATDALNEAEKTWTQSGPVNYTFDVRRVCFCPTAPTLRVTVRNKAPQTVINAATGMAADTTGLSDFLAMERIFGVLRRYINNNPAQFDAEYDATYGYPVFARIDPIAKAVDDEVQIQVTAFSPGLAAR